MDGKQITKISAYAGARLGTLRVPPRARRLEHSRALGDHTKRQNRPLKELCTYFSIVWYDKETAQRSKGDHGQAMEKPYGVMDKRWRTTTLEEIKRRSQIRGIHRISKC